MTNQDARFAGSIPQLYDHYLGPLLFEPYAEDLATRLVHVSDGAVLETAAGTGVVTRALAQRLPPSVRIVATDLNPAMLDILARRETRPSLRVQQADAQTLPFADGEFDALVCQFGMMFMPDKPRAFREARRVLARRGRFVFNVWDRLEANPVSEVVAQTIARAFPHDPPRFFERTPFGYHDEPSIREHLAQAGFTHVTIEVVEKATRAKDPHHVAFGLCQGTPMRSEIESRAPGGLEEITESVGRALAERFGTASFDHPMRALVVTAEV